MVRDTVDLLEKWLKRWEWIARFEEGEHNTHRRQLLVPDTFRVLGSLLWQLVLKEEVGNALHRYRGLTEEAGQTLRVLFCFDASAESLARLPWEFLYRPDAPGSRGYFLGTETNLVLSRYMALQKGRATMRATKDKLRIVLWLILPDTDDYQDDRKACLGTLDTLRTQLKGIATIPDHIDGWHPEQVTAQLGAKADIVHVVGIYRRVDDEFKIMLPNGRYEPSRILVDSLVRTPTHRPELVVLHLCDWPESDTTENFERLAPLLVERGIPAVLAMRYPMQPGDADAFLTAFYEELVDSNDVGKAVQAARARGYVQGEQRRFGAPVLYLQSVGGSLLDKEPGRRRVRENTSGTTSRFRSTFSEAWTRSEPGKPAAAARFGDIRQELLDVVAIEAPDAEARSTMERWVKAQNWPAEQAAAELIVQAGGRDQVDDEVLRPMFAAMLRALRRAA